MKSVEEYLVHVLSQIAPLPGLDVSLRGAASIARRLQDPLAELVKIDNSGHVVMLEKADEVNAALLPFVERLP